METNSIPNIQLVNIGTVKKPLNAVKGFIELPCWNGYYLVTQPNYRFKTSVVTNGRIELWVDAAITEDNNFSIDPEQVNAYQFLVQQQTEVKQAILEELKKQFPRLLQDEYASWDQDDGSMPLLTELTADFDFKNFIGPSSISIEEDVKDEIAYVKWQFQCLWDPEHGFEVITHKSRVIDIGPEADIFKINKDNGTYDELEKELANKQWKLPVKKKWWQFWKS
jgi:rubrerythrin